jgi:hypothetical protein
MKVDQIFQQLMEVSERVSKKLLLYAISKYSRGAQLLELHNGKGQM